MKYLFVGEKPSKTAYEKGWTWETGRLSAKQLFECLKMIGINPHNQKYTNLWTYAGKRIPLVNNSNLIIVGMGDKVHKELEKDNINHIHIYHPAVRGEIRKKQNYANHLKQKLLE